MNLVPVKRYQMRFCRLPCYADGGMGSGLGDLGPPASGCLELGLFRGHCFVACSLSVSGVGTSDLVLSMPRCADAYTSLLVGRNS